MNRLEMRYLKKIGPYAGPALIAAVGVVIWAWSWNYGPDALVDFGRELYVPWRLASGDILYQDIVYLNGPLTPYWNAAIFHIFGESLRTILIANTVVAVLITALLYSLLRQVSDRLGATTACLAFVSFIAFTQLGSMGNYNYLTPYSHEITHGLLLSLGSFWIFSLHPRYGQKAIMGSGFLLGLVLLTKVEVFLAAGLASGTGLVLTLWSQSTDRRRTLPWLLGFGAALATPVILTLILLTALIPPDLAIHALIDPWLSILNQDVTSLEFYRRVQGTDQLAVNLARITLWGVRYAIFIIPLVIIALCFFKKGPVRWIAAIGAFLLFSFAMGPGPYFSLWPGADSSHPAAMRIHEWPQAIRGLPLVLPLLAVGAFVFFWRNRKRGCNTQVDVLRLMVILFALGLLAKIFFNVRLHHYGFALAMPGTLVLIVVLVSWIPKMIDHYGGAGIIFQAASLAVVLVATVDMVRVIEQQYSKTTFQIGTGGDTFLSGRKAIYAAAALKEIERQVGPDETLAVIPEGIMLNYLSRRTTSTPHINFMPPEIMIYGEDRILRDFEASPPDYVVVVHKDTTEYGYPFFGQDYARNFYAWVRNHYTRVRLIGRPPLQQRRNFGIELLKRSEDGIESPSTGG